MVAVVLMSTYPVALRVRVPRHTCERHTFRGNMPLNLSPIRVKIVKRCILVSTLGESKPNVEGSRGPHPLPPLQKRTRGKSL
mgnify:CR=1 FL=1